MKIRSEKLGSPFLIISVLILLINDWILKLAFHNSITGKISDFAGLFSFAFFLSALFPKCTKVIYSLTAIFFIYWKSELSQSLINLLNLINVPVNRTVDYSDNVALIILPISYVVLKNETIYEIKPVLSKIIIVVCSVAFMATTLPPRHLRRFTEVNKTYHFNYSKRELIARYNSAQIEFMAKQNNRGAIKFNSETNTFHSDYDYRLRDTLPDTLAIMVDYEKIKGDTITLKTSFAEVKITGNETSSSLELLSVGKVVLLFKDKDFRQKAIKDFEKHIIKKLTSGG